MTREVKQDLWIERISNYRKSGLNAQTWCQQNNLTVSSLRYWINKCDKESLESDSCFKSEFVPITQVGIPMNPSAPVVIRYQNISIDVYEGCNPDTLRDVLEVLNVYA